MSGTTNILELPTENVKTSFTEQTQQGVALDENTISQIVSGLQRASVNGATLLPSRDIPVLPTDISNDAQVQPNYVPAAQPTQNDYIKNQEENDDISNNYNKRMETKNSIDDMYNELQTPLLLMVLYFLFQLRVYRKFLFNYFPVLFSKDGNININGLFFNSILFGFAYYVLHKSTELFGRF